MTREELNSELADQLNTLKAHSETLKKLVDDLQLTIRPQGDVTFSAMDNAKAVLVSIKEAKEATEKVKRALKARATERMKEG